MAVPVLMPRQGQSVESCVITKWHVRVGDVVRAGDALFSYETDKAAFDEAAKQDGTLLARFFNEGDDVPVLTNVAVLGAPGEAFAEFAPVGATGEAASVPAADAAKAAAPATSEGAPVEPTKEVEAAPGGATPEHVSPRARALAEKSGADLRRATATGPDGRVIARDVQALIDAGKLVTPAAREGYAGGVEGTGLGGRVTLSDLSKPAAAPAQAVQAVPAAQSAPAAVPEADSWDEPLSNMRKVIAKAMTASLSSMAQLTHSASFDATDIQALRKALKDKGEPFGLSKITLNDIVLYAVARTLADPAFKALNAHLIDGKTMRYFKGVHLGVAVDTERGLMVPTIFNADRLSLAQISATAKKLAADCQAGTINPDLLKGGTFTVSNLGALGVESFTPVINPPQTAILGVCAITTRVRDEGGTLVGYPAMGLSLTYDHRALDGAPASRFLKALKENLENFTLLLAKG